LLNLVNILKNEFTEGEDSGEVRVHLIFKLHNLKLGHLVLGMVKDLLTEHLQNIEIILTNVHIFHGTFTDVVDEGHPTGLPLVFDYLHQNRVAFVEDVVHRF